MQTSPTPGRRAGHSDLAKKELAAHSSSLIESSSEGSVEVDDDRSGGRLLANPIYASDAASEPNAQNDAGAARDGPSDGRDPGKDKEDAGEEQSQSQPRTTSAMFASNPASASAPETAGLVPAVTGEVEGGEEGDVDADHDVGHQPGLAHRPHADDGRPYLPDHESLQESSLLPSPRAAEAGCCDCCPCGCCRGACCKRCCETFSLPPGSSRVASVVMFLCLIVCAAGRGGVPPVAYMTLLLIMLPGAFVPQDKRTVTIAASIVCATAAICLLISAVVAGLWSHHGGWRFTEANITTGVVHGNGSDANGAGIMRIDHCFRIFGRRSHPVDFFGRSPAQEENALNEMVCAFGLNYDLSHVFISESLLFLLALAVCLAVRWEQWPARREPRVRSGRDARLLIVSLGPGTTDVLTTFGAFFAGTTYPALLSLPYFFGSILAIAVWSTPEAPVRRRRSGQASGNSGRNSSSSSFSRTGVLARICWGACYLYSAAYVILTALYQIPGVLPVIPAVGLVRVVGCGGDEDRGLSEVPSSCLPLTPQTWFVVLHFFLLVVMATLSGIQFFFCWSQQPQQPQQPHQSSTELAMAGDEEAKTTADADTTRDEVKGEESDRVPSLRGFGNAASSKKQTKKRLEGFGNTASAVAPKERDFECPTFFGFANASRERDPVLRLAAWHREAPIYRRLCRKFGWLVVYAALFCTAAFMTSVLNFVFLVWLTICFIQPALIQQYALVLISYTVVHLYFVYLYGSLDAAGFGMPRECPPEYVNQNDTVWVNGTLDFKRLRQVGLAQTVPSDGVRSGSNIDGGWWPQVFYLPGGLLMALACMRKTQSDRPTLTVQGRCRCCRGHIRIDFDAARKSGYRQFQRYEIGKYAALVLAYVDACINPDPFHFVSVIFVAAFMISHFFAAVLWIFFVLYSCFVVLALYFWQFFWMERIRILGASFFGFLGEENNNADGDLMGGDSSGNPLPLLPLPVIVTGFAVYQLRLIGGHVADRLKAGRTRQTDAPRLKEGKTSKSRIILLLIQLLILSLALVTVLAYGSKWEPVTFICLVYLAFLAVFVAIPGMCTGGVADRCSRRCQCCGKSARRDSVLDFLLRLKAPIEHEYRFALVLSSVASLVLLCRYIFEFQVLRNRRGTIDGFLSNATVSLLRRFNQSEFDETYLIETSTVTYFIGGLQPSAPRGCVASSMTSSECIRHWYASLGEPFVLIALCTMIRNTIVAFYRASRVDGAKLETRPAIPTAHLGSFDGIEMQDMHDEGEEGADGNPRANLKLSSSSSSSSASTPTRRGRAGSVAALTYNSFKRFAAVLVRAIELFGWSWRVFVGAAETGKIQGLGVWTSFTGTLTAFVLLVTAGNYTSLIGQLYLLVALLSILLPFSVGKGFLWRFLLFATSLHAMTLILSNSAVAVALRGGDWWVLEITDWIGLSAPPDRYAAYLESLQGLLVVACLHSVAVRSADAVSLTPSAHDTTASPTMGEGRDGGDGGDGDGDSGTSDAGGKDSAREGADESKSSKPTFSRTAETDGGGGGGDGSGVPIDPASLTIQVDGSAAGEAASSGRAGAEESVSGGSSADLKTESFEAAGLLQLLRGKAVHQYFTWRSYSSWSVEIAMVFQLLAAFFRADMWGLVYLVLFGASLVVTRRHLRRYWLGIVVFLFVTIFVQYGYNVLRVAPDLVIGNSSNFSPALRRILGRDGTTATGTTVTKMTWGWWFGLRVQSTTQLVPDFFAFVLAAFQYTRFRRGAYAGRPLGQRIFSIKLETLVDPDPTFVQKAIRVMSISSGWSHLASVMVTVNVNCLILERDGREDFVNYSGPSVRPRSTTPMSAARLWRKAQAAQLACYLKYAVFAVFPYLVLTTILIIATAYSNLISLGYVFLVLVILSLGLEKSFMEHPGLWLALFAYAYLVVLLRTAFQLPVITEYCTPDSVQEIFGLHKSWIFSKCSAATGTAGASAGAFSAASFVGMNSTTPTATSLQPPSAHELACLEEHESLTRDIDKTHANCPHFFPRELSGDVTILILLLLLHRVVTHPQFCFVLRALVFAMRDSQDQAVVLEKMFEGQRKDELDVIAGEITALLIASNVVRTHLPSASRHASVYTSAGRSRRPTAVDVPGPTVRDVGSERPADLVEQLAHAKDGAAVPAAETPRTAVARSSVTDILGGLGITQASHPEINLENQLSRHWTTHAEEDTKHDATEETKEDVLKDGDELSDLPPSSMDDAPPLRSLSRSVLRQTFSMTSKIRDHVMTGPIPSSLSPTTPQTGGQGRALEAHPNYPDHPGRHPDHHPHKLRCCSLVGCGRCFFMPFRFVLRACLRNSLLIVAVAMLVADLLERSILSLVYPLLLFIVVLIQNPRYMPVLRLQRPTSRHARDSAVTEAESANAGQGSKAEEALDVGLKKTDGQEDRKSGLGDGGTADRSGGDGSGSSSIGDGVVAASASARSAGRTAPDPKSAASRRSSRSTKRRRASTTMEAFTRPRTDAFDIFRSLGSIVHNARKTVADVAAEHAAEAAAKAESAKKAEATGRKQGTRRLGSRKADKNSFLLHPMVQNPPPHFWHGVVIFTVAVMCAKFAYQNRAFCVCYGPWPSTCLKGASAEECKASTYSRWPFCATQKTTADGDTCRLPLQPVGERFRPFDVTWGIRKFGPGESAEPSEVDYHAASHANGAGVSAFIGLLPDLLVLAAVLLHLHVVRTNGFFLLREASDLRDLQRLSQERTARRSQRLAQRLAKQRNKKNKNKKTLVPVAEQKQGLEEKVQAAPAADAESKTRAAAMVAAAAAAAATTADDDAVAVAVLGKDNNNRTTGARGLATARSSQGNESKSRKHWLALKLKHEGRYFLREWQRIVAPEKLAQSGRSEGATTTRIPPPLILGEPGDTKSSGGAAAATRGTVSGDDKEEIDDRVQLKPGYDFYVRIFLWQFVSFVFLIIFFQNPNRVQKMFTDGGQISGTYVLALFSQFVLMVADRLCYLMRKGEWKLLLHFIYLVTILVLTHSDAGLSLVGAERESILVAWYVIQLPYLYYSSLQIGYGYPFNVHDQWIMKKINWLYAYLFIIYKAIPFMYEMRMLLDWTCSHTTMRFFEWVKLEDIRDSLFLTTCWVDYYKTEARPKGGIMPLSRKIGQGVLLFILLCAILWLPLAVFALEDFAGDANATLVNELQFELQIPGFPALFTASTTQPDTFMEGTATSDPKSTAPVCPLDLPCPNHIKGFDGQTGSSLQECYQTLKSFSTDDRRKWSQTTQRVNLQPGSITNWAITSSGLERLLADLENPARAAQIKLSLSVAASSKTSRNAGTFTQGDGATFDHQEMRGLLNGTMQKVKVLNLVPRFLVVTPNKQTLQSAKSILETVETGGGPSAATQVLSRDGDCMDNDLFLYCELRNPQWNFTENRAEPRDIQWWELYCGDNPELNGRCYQATEENGVDILLKPYKPGRVATAEYIFTENNQENSTTAAQCADEETRRRIIGGPLLYVFTEPTALGSQFVAAGGIITLYIGLVYTLSRLIRSSIIGNKGDIMFGDLPTTNLLTEKVEMLYKVRTVANLRPQQISDVFRKRLVDDTQLLDPEDDDESDDDGDDAQTAAGLRKKETRRSALLLQKVMELEEEYYQMIIDIYRQPHLLYQHTGPYRHWWGSRTKGVSLCATPLPELNAPDGDELNTVPPRYEWQLDDEPYDRGGETYQLEQEAVSVLRRRRRQRRRTEASRGEQKQQEQNQDDGGSDLYI